MRRARLILPLLAACVLRGSASAQVDVVADAGLSYLRQTGIPQASALTLGATFDAAATNAFFRAAGLGARAGGDSYTGQMVALFAIVDPSLRLLRWEIDGSASAFGQTFALPATSGELAARLRMGDNARGASIGVGGGEARRLATAEPVTRALATAWLLVGAERFSADLSVSHARFAARPASFPTALTVEKATYTDLAGSWRHDRGGVSAGITAGVRSASSGNVTSGGWFAADATMWLSPHAGLVVSAGRTLEDVVRGFPRTSYASVSLRLSRAAHETLSDTRTRATGVQIMAHRMSGGAVAFDVVAPGASSVELMADFTDWSPVALVATDGVWRLEHAAAPGAHRLALRLDGGDWIVPANLPSITDELGGNVGVITIP